MLVALFSRKALGQFGRVMESNRKPKKRKSFVSSLLDGPHSAPIAHLLLFGLTFSILLGPRVGIFGFDQGDFRFQDFLVLVTSFLLVVHDLHRLSTDRFCWQRTITHILLSLATSSVMYYSATQAFSMSSFYTLRLIEVPLLAFLIYRLLDKSGARGVMTLLFTFGFGLFANLTWMALQQILQVQGALWVFGSGGVEPQYGPGLIGEPATFPAAQTLIILLAGLLSAFFAMGPKGMLNASLFGLSISLTLGAVFLTQSRISIAVAIILVGIFLVWLAHTRLSRLLLFKAICVAGILGVGLSLSALSGLVPGLPRFNQESIYRGLELRWQYFYEPVIKTVAQNSVFGAGPGIGRELLGTEVHSLYLEILLDFGVIGALGCCLSTILLLNGALRRARSAVGMESMFATWTVFIVLNLLITGIVQSSHMSTTPNHLGAVVLGTFLWLTCSRHSPDASDLELSRQKMGPPKSVARSG